ncbi:MAG: type II toxin-antitoxin system VapC family toxin [Armatimonadetes bacterium]|nr:type II toxin-antitoxin system VapC family toxin [Armatimonadota bacterium]
MVSQEICIDASVLVKWIAPEELRDQALALARSCEELGYRYVAPEFVFAEATNGVLKHVRKGTMPVMEGLQAMSLIYNTPVEKFTCRDLYIDAWRIALTYDRPAIYDCYYLALAEDRGCDLWTADNKFYNAVGNHPHVKHIKDFVPGALEK